MRYICVYIVSFSPSFFFVNPYFSYNYYLRTYLLSLSIYFVALILMLRGLWYAVLLQDYTVFSIISFRHHFQRSRRLWNVHRTRPKSIDGSHRFGITIFFHPIHERSTSQLSKHFPYKKTLSNSIFFEYFLNEMLEFLFVSMMSVRRRENCDSKLTKPSHRKNKISRRLNNVFYFFRKNHFSFPISNFVAYELQRTLPRINTNFLNS